MPLNRSSFGKFRRILSRQADEDDVESRSSSASTMESCGAGPGFASPMAAMEHGQREKILYVNCARHADSLLPNFLATVDVDPNSSSYGEIISQLNLLHVGDELHRSGWNACSSCYGCSHARRRSHLVLPCLNSSRIYIVNVQNEREPCIETVIEPERLHELGVTFPHTSHCLADGSIMVSTIGDQNGDSKGSFILIDGDSFTATEKKWSKDEALYGSDFWYQPRWNVMVAGAWGSPKKIKNGIRLADFHNGDYGSTLSIWNWRERRLAQNLNLGKQFGNMPFELRFLHDPDSPVGFVAATFASIIYRLSPENSTATKPDQGSPPPRYKADPVIAIPHKKVANWLSRRMPAFITTLIISMDDRYLYCNSWLHGTVRQYDISNTAYPKLVGQVFMGGLVTKDSSVQVIGDAELPAPPEPVTIKGRKIVGGPQMLQLSLDGKRLYVTTSLYSIWDKQVYPEMIENGAVMVQIDVDTEHGGLSINMDFLVDFGQAPGGPALANDMRYPGGDCSSDIWI